MKKVFKLEVQNLEKFLMSAGVLLSAEYMPGKAELIFGSTEADAITLRFEEELDSDTELTVVAFHKEREAQWLPSFRMTCTDMFVLARQRVALLSAVRMLIKRVHVKPVNPYEEESNLFDIYVLMQPDGISGAAYASLHAMREITLASFIEACFNTDGDLEFFDRYLPRLRKLLKLAEKRKDKKLDREANRLKLDLSKRYTRATIGRFVQEIARGVVGCRIPISLCK